MALARHLYLVADRHLRRCEFSVLIYSHESFVLAVVLVVLSNKTIAVVLARSTSGRCPLICYPHPASPHLSTPPPAPGLGGSSNTRASLMEVRTISTTVGSSRE
jgi:hypothetical protein